MCSACSMKYWVSRLATSSSQHPPVPAHLSHMRELEEHGGLHLPPLDTLSARPTASPSRSAMTGEPAIHHHHKRVLAPCRVIAERRQLLLRAVLGDSAHDIHDLVVADGTPPFPAEPGGLLERASLHCRGRQLKLEHRGDASASTSEAVLPERRLVAPGKTQPAIPQAQRESAGVLSD